LSSIVSGVFSTNELSHPKVSIDYLIFMLFSKMLSSPRCLSSISVTDVGTDIVAGFSYITLAVAPFSSFAKKSE